MAEELKNGIQQMIPQTAQTKRNKKIPDWDLYDTDEEAMESAEAVMLEDMDYTPWSDDWTFGDVVKNMHQRHKHIPLARVRELIADEFPADDKENFNEWRERMWDHYDNKNK